MFIWVFKNFQPPNCCFSNPVWKHILLAAHVKSTKMRSNKITSKEYIRTKWTKSIYKYIFFLPLLQFFNVVSVHLPSADVAYSVQTQEIGFQASFCYTQKFLQLSTLWGLGFYFAIEEGCLCDIFLCEWFPHVTHVHTFSWIIHLVSPSVIQSVLHNNLP